MGMGKGLFFFLLVLIGLLAFTVWKVTRRAGPILTLKSPVKGIGLNTEIAVDAVDDRYNLRRLEVVLSQGDRSYRVMDETIAGPPRWKFWSDEGIHRESFSARAGRRQIPDLKEGQATLRITAVNDSWGNFFQGGKTDIVMELPVRLTPPQVEVLSFPHHINQGGAELVVFRVSEGTTRSGVQVGDHFFPSWPLKDSVGGTRMCLFAFPYNLDPGTPLKLQAVDDAGNEAIASFSYRVFPKKFRSDNIPVTDDFISGVIPPIMSQSGLDDQGSPLKNFLMVNNDLRRANARELVAYSQKTAEQFLWTKPFLQLGNSQVEASFADDRTYLYNGEAVDQQTHLGFDLASTRHAAIVAANDGVVIHAGYFGIYGNTVILDHGCGLQSLYAHMSSIGVKAGDQVNRGQEIGRSGQTGLAGGDHLHFTMLVGGEQVTPVDWWSPQWMRDRILRKIEAAGSM